MSESVLFQGGRIIDPSQGIDAAGDLGIRDGRVEHCGGSADASKYDTVVPVSGCWVAPGFVDMHVHFREPGQEQKETIATGVRAAVAGGYSSVACMANTIPVIDQESLVRFVLERGRAAGYANVFPIGAITVGLQGKQLTEMDLLAKAGAVAFSDDGIPVWDDNIMRLALDYSKMVGKVIIDHCEAPELTKGSVMNESPMSTRLGLKGWPTSAEDIMVYRNIALCETTGAPVHIAHLSTAESVRLVRDAKERGLPVTAEVTPHHLLLDDSELWNYDSNYRMNPPLRSKEDVEACIAGLADGTIDAIASDHAPHTLEDKENELGCCANGIIGLETSVPVVFTDLVAKGKLSAERFVDASTVKPARILGLEGRGTLEVGAHGDVTVLDPGVEWKIDAEQMHSLSHNCPFNGMSVTGRARHVAVSGNVYDCTSI